MSILDYDSLKKVLGIPQDVWVVAYLCVGYVKGFAHQPDLEQAGWRKPMPLEELVHYERWGTRSRDESGPSGPDLKAK